MADIELVIKISKEDYETIKKDTKEFFSKPGHKVPTLYKAVNEGIPLPKGRGRIGDLDKLIKTMKERNNDNGGEPLNTVDRGYDLAYQHMVKEAEECVIIEADKE